MYLASEGTKVSFSPRLAHTEYSYTEALVWSFSLDISLAGLPPKTVPSLFKTSTIKLSGNSYSPLSELDWTWICPLRRYLSPFKWIGYKTMWKYENKGKGNDPCHEKEKLYKCCTNVSDVSIFIDELPKKIHESTKWSSCTPGDSTQICCKPFCSSKKERETENADYEFHILA